MYVVFGLRLYIWSRSPDTVSNEGKRSGGYARLGNSASSSQRSLCRSMGTKNCCGSAVWMMTGTFASAHTCQIGSRSGSSTLRRDPSALRAVRPRFFAILSPIAPLRRTSAVPIHPREDAEAVLVRRSAEEVHVFAQRVGAAGARREIDEHAQVQLVHLANHLVDIAGRDRRVVVDVDDRVLRFRYEVLRRNNGGTRPVVDDRRRRFFGRLAGLRAHLGHPGRTFFARFDRDPGTLTASALTGSERRAQRDCRRHHRPS